MRVDIFGLLLVATAVAGRPERPVWVNCVSSSDCFKQECCTIGAGKYSIPQCKPHPERDDPCRPGKSTTMSSNVTYPDGSTVVLEEVHFMYCPCAMGLGCDPATLTCQPLQPSFDFNSIDDYY